MNGISNTRVHLPVMSKQWLHLAKSLFINLLRTQTSKFRIHDFMCLTCDLRNNALIPPLLITTLYGVTVHYANPTLNQHLIYTINSSSVSSAVGRYGGFYHSGERQRAHKQRAHCSRGWQLNETHLVAKRTAWPSLWWIKCLSSCRKDEVCIPRASTLPILILPTRSSFKITMHVFFLFFFTFTSLSFDLVMSFYFTPEI